jgi:hypothetical protein
LSRSGRSATPIEINRFRSGSRTKPGSASKGH